MTAARHFDRFAAVLRHHEIVAMAPAAIYSCLARDTSAGVAIGGELADMGATSQEIAWTFDDDHGDAGRGVWRDG